MKTRGLETMKSTNDAGKPLRRATRVSPARKEPDESTYRGRVSRLWIALRAGRDVDDIAKAVRKAGHKCSKATYYNWETGVTDPPIAALPAIAKALSVQVADLFPKK